MSKDRLTNDELSEVLEFAQALYQGVGYGGLFSPYGQNSNLLGLNGKSTKFTKEELVKALEASPYDYRKLAEYSSFYETVDAIYAKTIRYFVGLLSFDLTWSCTNIKDPSEYASKAYQDDIKRVYKFLDKFDYKQEFRKIVSMMMKRDTVYTWFRDSHEINSPIEIDNNKIKKDEHFALQILPQDICILTGYFNNSQLLFDMDMNYFLGSNVDINLYAPQVKKMLKETYKDNGEYKPSASLYTRNGSYANYVQCKPIDGAYAFKFDISTFAQKPPFANLMLSCLDNQTMANLQMDKNMLSAWYMITGEIPLLSNTKSEKANQFAISPEAMGKFLSLVNSGIKANIKPVLMPASNIRGYSFDDQNPSMYKNQLQTSAGQGASASSMIYTDGKLSQSELINAIQTDYNYIKQVYNQFAQFLNFFVNKKTIKYTFDFTLDGLDRDWYRDEQLTNMMKLSDKGLTLPPQYFASTLGIKPQNFARALQEAHYSGMADELTMLMNINTSKDGLNTDSNDGGRPTKEGLDKSDSTEEVQDNGD